MTRSNWCCVVLCLMAIGGCSVFNGDQFTESSPQDTPEEVRLKAVLLEVDDIAGSAIDVIIDERRIILEGFVEKDAQRQRAEDLMHEHSELNEVVNRIKVK